MHLNFPYISISSWEKAGQYVCKFVKTKKYWFELTSVATSTDLRGKLECPFSDHLFLYIDTLATILQSTLHEANWTLYN
jgi:hypothetical protein